MRKIFIAALLAAIATPAVATSAEGVPDSGVTTIVVDTRVQGCQGGRVADHYRLMAQVRAKKLAKALRAEGKEVRIITGAPGTPNGWHGSAAGAAPVYISAC